MTSTDTSKIAKSHVLKDFLIENLPLMSYDSSFGSSPSFPRFDLFARDYLQFAEHELLQLKNDSSKIEHIHLINCVSHLKRAIDCQLDVCLHVLNIKVFKEKNLGFNAKLNFFKAAGLFNSFSLNRFNTIRNKMEHHYQIPKIEDIESYFDFVSAFVSVLESMINMLCNYSEIFLTNDDHANRKTRDTFAIQYSFDDIPQITYSITKKSLKEYVSNPPSFEFAKYPEEREEVEVTVTSEERDEFPYFLKVLLLLARKDTFASDKYILSQLENLK
ncbi:hypothetical protein [Peribacillus frigoritolerans]|uniref:hypothetical protein n=1 Tax=Peribacillus frigoritolerans TaxID=450367 RepID=UPI0020BFF044|nr:hypothetical protein [Peribacillus frigoritolerans]MEE3951649.1 hypothetical protein [Peribacillus frigoritolerans]